MTEPSSAEAEAPIEVVGEGPPAADTGAEQAPPGEPPVDPDDKLEDFNPHDGDGWPDPPFPPPGPDPDPLIG